MGRCLTSRQVQPSGQSGRGIESESCGVQSQPKVDGSAVDGLYEL